MRTVYALETTAPFLALRFNPLRLESTEEKVAYIRGYFDAEGGIPHSKKAPFYIQLCQKHKLEMKRVKLILEALGIQCGKIHNPSKDVDPNYWRLSVRARSHRNFIRVIGLWHPRKRTILQRRMMI
ncbi:LAGLIDADG family homing endonuclease [Candidatus Peregrinibacteria bacterium]|nr:LAGLIDADG family homing endonuclease [Candidatus Peregrinibacteria bacterium]MBI3816548.1 LAGLIDADG family homing endonuclease [Candidatus Peregrinibacteria bacterium]